MTSVPWNCITATEKQRVVIIGAGPTGLGAAHRLAKLGVLRSNTQVIVLDKQGTPEVWLHHTEIEMVSFGITEVM